MKVPFSEFSFVLKPIWKIIYFSTVSLLALTLNLSAQDQTKNWYFGNGMGLGFGTSSVTPISGALTGSLGCASISDATGNLLFYTDGVTVWDKSHGVMANGNGLLGLFSTQPCVIVPQPGSNTLYYIFTVKAIGSNALNYSIIDMSLSSGQGSVTVKNANLSSSAFEGKLSAVTHCNGSDVWIVAMDSISTGSAFKAYLLTSAGVNTTAVSSPGYGHNGRINYGSMKLSPNGKKLALCVNYYSNLFSWNGIENQMYLFDFDNSTGIVSNRILVQKDHIPNMPLYYGCEFSPDGTKLYTSSLASVWQWDVCALQNSTPNVPTALTPLPTSASNYDASTIKGLLQLGSDGKIYVARKGKDSLGVILNPNILGNNCQFLANGQSIGTSTCGFGLPNFITTYFENRSTFSSLTFSSSTTSCRTLSFTSNQPCAETGYTIATQHWDFGELSAGSSNTSSAINPVHQYAAPGTYTVQRIVNYNCNKADTVKQQVLVTDPPISLTTQSFVCGFTNATLTSNWTVVPLSFTWFPTMLTSPAASNLPDGTYTVIMQDGQSCKITKVVNMLATTLSVSTTVSSVSCYGLSNGHAAFFISGGSGSYNYTWSPGGMTTPSVTALPAGIYTVSGGDSFNTACMVTRTIQITQPPMLAATIGASSFSACVGDTLILFPGANGGTPGYSYLWNDGQTGADTLHQSTGGASVSSLLVTDANNCTSLFSIQINFIARPILVAPSIAVCSSHSATMSVTGATSYTWIPSLSNVNSFTVLPTCSQIYTVIGSTSGCSSYITSSLTVNPSPVASIFNSGPVCEGQIAFFDADGGANYLWSGPAGYSDTIKTPSLMVTSVHQSGLYTVTVTNNYSCSSSANMYLTVQQSPILNVSGNFTICEGETTVLSASGADTYVWNNVLFSQAASFSPPITTTYTVRGISSDTQCSSVSVVTLNVQECTGLEVLKNSTEIRFYPNPVKDILFLESPTSFTASIYNELGILLFEKQFEAGAQKIDLSRYPVALYFLTLSTNTKQSVFKLIKDE